MIVIGGGATGLQVASIFGAFGTAVTLFDAGPRILATEDEAVAAAVISGFRARDIGVREGFGWIERFEPCAGGTRMVYSGPSGEEAAEASVIVSAIGWEVDGETLGLEAAAIETTERGFIKIDPHGRTSAEHIFAAGDVTGIAMLAPQAMHQGFIAASAALGLPEKPRLTDQIVVGSFTDPEYARAGLTEAQYRQHGEPVSALVPYSSATRPIIDGQTLGFCKLTADRSTRRIVGCSLVGDRAVDIAQIAAVAMAAGLRVEELASFPLSFPVYAGLLSQAAVRLGRALNQDA